MARKKNPRVYFVPGTTYQRKDGTTHSSPGRWRWNKRVTDPTGRTRTITISEPTRDAAITRAREIEDQLDRGITVTGRTLADWLDYWEGHILDDGSRRPNTLAAHHTSVLAIKRHLGRTKLADLKPHHIRTLYETLRNTTTRRGTRMRTSTIGTIAATLKLALKAAVAEGYIGTNPCDVVRPPRSDGQHHPQLTLEEVRQLLQLPMGERDRARFVVALLGLRQGEALALRWRDIHYQDGWIDVNAGSVRVIDGKAVRGPTKTRSSERPVSLPPVAAAALQAWQKLCPPLQDGFVFWSTYRGPHLPLTPPADRAAFKRIAGMVTDNPSLHGLRGTVASLQMEAGVPARVIADQLGHTNVAMTQNTYQVSTPEARAAAAGDMFLSAVRETDLQPGNIAGVVDLPGGEPRPQIMP